MAPAGTESVTTATEAYSMAAEQAGCHREVGDQQHGRLGRGGGQHHAVHLERTAVGRAAPSRPAAGPDR